MAASAKTNCSFKTKKVLSSCDWMLMSVSYNHICPDSNIIFS